LTNIKLDDLSLRRKSRMVTAFFKCLNGVDVTAKHTTIRLLERAEKSITNVNPLAHPGLKPRSHKWKLFPPNFAQVRKIMSELDLRAFPTKPFESWTDVPEVHALQDPKRNSVDKFPSSPETAIQHNNGYDPG